MRCYVCWVLSFLWTTAANYVVFFWNNWWQFTGNKFWAPKHNGRIARRNGGNSRKRSHFLLPEKGSGKLCRSTLVTWYIVFFDLPKQNSQELLFSFLVVSARAACDNMETIKIHIIHASRLMTIIYTAHACLFAGLHIYDISGVWSYIWNGYLYNLYTLWIWVPYGSQLLMPWIARILAGRWDGHLAASNNIYTCNMM